MNKIKTIIKWTGGKTKEKLPYKINDLFVEHKDWFNKNF